MPSPSAFFSFTHFHGNGASKQQITVAYKAPGAIERGSLDELMTDVCRGPHLPDAVLIVSVDDPNSDLLAMLEEERAKAAQERLRGRIPLLHANYSLKEGAVKVTLLDRAFESRERALTKVCEKVSAWIKSGLLELFHPDRVVLQAPPGYSYQKPSGGRTSIFLKPDLAFTSSASVSFVAFALFHKVFSSQPKRLNALRVVYVDTMAVAAVAYGLRELVTLVRRENAFQIESFHSYDGFSEVARPLSMSSLCVISASTSMDLHGKWIAEKQVSTSEVVTLVTLESVEKYKDGALVAIAANDPTLRSDPVQFSIRIKGESFLPEQEPAKKILLTDLHHRCDEEVDKFRSLASRGVFDIYRRPAVSPSKARALFVDGDILMSQSEFKEWLTSYLNQTVKACVRLIVHQNDDASKRLASEVHDYCVQKLGLSLPKPTSARELSEHASIGDAGVIVCAAVVGKGSQLLEISRSLRDIHSGPRLYVIGFQVTEMRSEISGLDKNLRHSKGVPNEIVRYAGAAIGTQLLASFKLEHDTYHLDSVDVQAFPSHLQRRIKVLGSTEQVGELALLPHGESLDKAMRIRKGFAFWPAFEPSPCQPEIVATMAVLLQRAREYDKLAEDRRLAVSSYRHVILDPENFARYNDGVIQAAILRAAYPSEMDYRADHGASDFMKALVVRAIHRADQEAGEAALEFLLALSLRRLQISEQHLAEVMIAAEELATRSSELQSALHFLLETTGHKKKLPF
jgi:hypothetical protein